MGLERIAPVAKLHCVWKSYQVRGGSKWVQTCSLQELSSRYPSLSIFIPSCARSSPSLIHLLLSPRRLHPSNPAFLPSSSMHSCRHVRGGLLSSFLSLSPLFPATTPLFLSLSGWVRRRQWMDSGSVFIGSVISTAWSRAPVRG